MERFIKISGYDNYSVSNKGRVRNDKSGRILKLHTIPQGYFQAQLSKGGKVYHLLVHRLVAEAFLPNPNQFPIINHINEDKGDNRVENLEWCTYQYNLNYKSRDRRTPVELDGEKYPSITDAAKHIGVHPNTLTSTLSQGRTRYKNHTISYVN